MGKHERRAYLEAIRKRYCCARRSDKGRIWMSSVRHAVISASTLFGYGEANLPPRCNALDDESVANNTKSIPRDRADHQGRTVESGSA
jgi:hypothetical protein